jgi:lantibiotic transport system ATP-binding protein
METRRDWPATAIRTNGLGKSFGSHRAVWNLDLEVASGDIYGFLGRNGAGKTTTIRLLLGLLRPTSGTVRIFDHDIAQDRISAARLTGSLLEARATYDNLSGRQNLDSTRRLLGLPGKEIDRVLEIVDMSQFADGKAGHYSLGMRQRLGLARALLGSPRLLILDEPMNGLDPDGIRAMRTVIRDLPERSGVTIFLSSHLLSEVQQTASSIGLIHDGRLVLQGSMTDLLQRVTPELFIKTTDLPRTLNILAADGYAPQQEGAGMCVKLTHIGSDLETARINKRLVEAGLGVIELNPRQATLEALYLQVQKSENQVA